jgi:hypothetical protein
MQPKKKIAGWCFITTRDGVYIYCIGRELVTNSFRNVNWKTFWHDCYKIEFIKEKKKEKRKEKRYIQKKKKKKKKKKGNLKKRCITESVLFKITNVLFAYEKPHTCKLTFSHT